MGINERVAVRESAFERLKKFRFGDEVTNVCAGKKNPNRHVYFVRAKTPLIEVTNKNGDFWDVNMDVIFAGRLEYSECEKLYHPIWEANYK